MTVALELAAVSAVSDVTSIILLRTLLGAGDAARSSSSLLWLVFGLALLDSSVSGGVGIMNWFPLRLSGFWKSLWSSLGAGRFRRFVSGGDETISSIGVVGGACKCEYVRPIFGCNHINGS